MMIGLQDCIRTTSNIKIWIKYDATVRPKYDASKLED